MTERDEQQFLDAYTREAKENQEQPIEMTVSLDVVLSIVPALQLALRHPGFSGSQSALNTRRFIASVIDGFAERGLTHIASVLNLGNDPANDKVC